MHEFDAERLTVSTLADCDDFAKRTGLKSEHMIEENLAVEIGIREAIRTRIEFFMILLTFDTERIKIGVEMSAHAIGANEHQGTNRVARCLLDVRRREIVACGLSLGGEFSADDLFNLRPIAIERRCELIARRSWPVRLLPARALRVLLNVGGRVLQAFEKLGPVRIDRRGVLLEPRIHVVDVGGVGAVEEGSESKIGVRVLARHVRVLILATGGNIGANCPIGGRHRADCCSFYPI